MNHSSNKNTVPACNRGQSSSSSKYYRRSGGSSSETYSGKRKVRADKHVAIIIFTVLATYLFIMLIVYYYDLSHSRQSYLFNLWKSNEAKGVTFSLEKSPKLFELKGFQYFESSPISIASKYPTLNSQKLWFLNSTEVGPASGTITFRNIQSRIARRSAATQASLFLKYHVHYHREPSMSPHIASGFVDLPTSALLRISSYNFKTHEVTTVDLDQYGTSGYCSRVVFLDASNEVRILALPQAYL